jgi:hypothetical protein
MVRMSISSQPLPANIAVPRDVAPHQQDLSSVGAATSAAVPSANDMADDDDANNGGKPDANGMVVEP